MKERDRAAGQLLELEECSASREYMCVHVMQSSAGKGEAAAGEERGSVCSANRVWAIAGYGERGREGEESMRTQEGQASPVLMSEQAKRGREKKRRNKKRRSCFGACVSVMCVYVRRKQERERETWTEKEQVFMSSQCE